MTDWHERWRAPLVWWVIGVGVSLGAAVELHASSGSLLPYLLLPPAAVAGLLWLSRQQVRLTGDLVHVPGARAPRTAFADPEVLDREALRAWRGPRAHRDAWVCVRPWHTRAVRLPVTDPDDDTPYWLVGSRRPERLAEQLGAR